MNKGSITKVNEDTVKVEMAPFYLMEQPAFIRQGDNPEPVTPGMDMKEMIATVAWAQLAYKAPHLFKSNFHAKRVSFQNGLFVVEYTSNIFGFVHPLG